MNGGTLQQLIDSIISGTKKIGFDEEAIASIMRDILSGLC